MIKKNKKINEERRHSYENLEKLSFAFNLLNHPSSSSTFRRWMESDCTNLQQINKLPPSLHSGKEENDWKPYVGWRREEVDTYTLYTSI
ncbi:hypothetical protein, partial [Streptococcus suis]|uniref:hypothetical protein n=1 Tax=Streptococcus suis TaxID=1307 RepID=UPI002AAC2E65